MSKQKKFKSQFSFAFSDKLNRQPSEGKTGKREKKKNIFKAIIEFLSFMFF